MRINSAFAAFLDDTGRQQQLRDAGQYWLSRFRDASAIRSLSDRLENLVHQPPASVADFARRLRPWTDALDWIDDAVDDALGHIASDPFAHLPWGLASTAVLHALALIVHDRAHCTLAVLDARALAATPTRHIMFDAGFSAAVLLSGGKVLAKRFVLDRRGGLIASAGSRELAWRQPLFMDCAREQWVLTSAERDAVLLRISFGANAPSGRIYEYDADTGQRRREAVSDRATSRKLALLPLAVLSANKAALIEALEMMVNDADSTVRWEAMRHLIHRAPATAQPILSGMARADADPVVRSLAMQTLDLLSMPTMADGG